MITTNPLDIVKCDIPLLIRLLEYAREDAKTDMDLHDVAENITELSKAGSTLSMKDYEAIVKPRQATNEMRIMQHRAGIRM